MAEVLVELDDCWTLEHLKEGDLTMSCFLIFCVHVIEVDLFQRVLFSIKDVTVEAHAACSSLTQRPNLLVLCKTGEFL